MVRGVHAFVYLWYRSLEFDGKYAHWDHEILPHWHDQVNAHFPQVRSRPFDPAAGKLHSPYFPLRGAYSSRDPTVIIAQLSELAAAGVDVAVLSWWGQKDKSYATDTQGVNTDQILSEYLSVADTQAAVKIAFHLEPYPGRSADSVRADIEYIYREYGHHECLLQSPLLKRGEDPAPQSETSGGSGREAGLLFYVYDSYHTDASDWAEILLPANGSNSINKSIRGTLLDSTVIGLWLDSHHGEELLSAGFDGFYSYFSSDGFSYGSTTANWPRMCERFDKAGRVCVLSVGPGYDDEKIRPWNSANTKRRNRGEYYRNMWNRASVAAAHVISVTSYNEIGEGTQIEPCMAPVRGYKDEGYADNPYFYMNLTKSLVDSFKSANGVDDDTEKLNFKSMGEL